MRTNHKFCFFASPLKELNKYIKIIIYKKYERMLPIKFILPS